MFLLLPRLSKEDSKYNILRNMNSDYIDKKKILKALTISDELNVYCSVGVWSEMPATDINRGLV